MQEVAIEAIGPQTPEAVPRREAFRGWTFDTRKTSSRRPAIASPTMRSTAPCPYDSAVSMWVMPRSSPRRSALTAARGETSIRQVPWPKTGTEIPVEPKGRCSIRGRSIVSGRDT